MSRSDRRADRRGRRSVLGVGAAAGAAFAAALIGLAHAPAARADEPEPFQDLFGDTGFNSWTPSADTDLAALSPTLDADFATSVDNFFLQTDFSCFIETSCADDPFTLLANSLDPSAFSNHLPDNAIGDLAVGLDYTTFASGLGPVVDVPIDLLFGFYSIF
jgi:hypothetical protein